MKERSVRVALVQYGMRKIRNFEEFGRDVEYFVSAAASYEADIVHFPELLTLQLLSFIRARDPTVAIRRVASFTDSYTRMFSDLSREYGLFIVGGSHPTLVNGELHNTGYLFTPSGKYHQQEKIHITPDERVWGGFTGGSSLAVFDTKKAKIAISVCYDIEFPEIARVLTSKGAEIIFVPFMTDERKGYLRVRYCSHARAVENQIYVSMAGTVGNLAHAKNLDLQYAQSAILTPSDFPFARDGIAAEASLNNETMVICDLDASLLDVARRNGTVTQFKDLRRDISTFPVKTFTVR